MGPDLRGFYANYIRRCNVHRVDDLGEFVAETVTGSAQGLDEYRDGLRDVISAFPDYHWTVEHLIVEGDTIAVRLTGTGTHLGSFRGIEPTGRVIRTQELAIYRIEGGRITACWGDLGSTVRDELVSGSGSE